LQVSTADLSVTSEGNLADYQLSDRCEIVIILTRVHSYVLCILQAITDEIYKLLESRCGLQKVLLPVLYRMMISSLANINYFCL